MDYFLFIPAHDFGDWGTAYPKLTKRLLSVSMLKLPLDLSTSHKIQKFDLKTLDGYFLCIPAYENLWFSKLEYNLSSRYNSTVR